NKERSYRISGRSGRNREIARCELVRRAHFTTMVDELQRDHAVFGATRKLEETKVVVEDVVDDRSVEPAVVASILPVVAVLVIVRFDRMYAGIGADQLDERVSFPRILDSAERANVPVSRKEEHSLDPFGEHPVEKLLILLPEVRPVL